MAVVELTMRHAHVSPTLVAAEHELGVGIRVQEAIVVGCEAEALASTKHRHAPDGEVVVRRGMPGHTTPREEVVALVVLRAAIGLVLVGVEVFLVTVAPAPVVLAVAVTDVEIGIEERTVVIDVETGVGTAPRVATRLNGAIVARLALLLEHDVDDAGTALGREFG